VARIRSLLKCITPPFLWSFLRAFLTPRSKYFALSGLDQKLEKYLNYRDGFYVELGANDGVAQSNTRYFEKEMGWRGVLVEPTPHNYLLCLLNRSPRNKFFCRACVSFAYRERFVEIAFSNLMSSPMGLESDIADPLAHAKKGLTFLQEGAEVFTFGALAEPLSGILDSAQAPFRIDFLSLDVEGAELEVLKGVDHRRHRFRYICVECRDIDRLSGYLIQHRYEMVEPLSAHDYLFRDTTWSLGDNALMGQSSSKKRSNRA